MSQKVRNIQQQSLGEFIRTQRVERGMSKAELARAVGVAKTAPTRWEQGDGPGADRLPRIAEALNVPEARLRELHRNGFEDYVRGKLDEIHESVTAIPTLMEDVMVQLRLALKQAEARGQTRQTRKRRPPEDQAGRQSGQ